MKWVNSEGRLPIKSWCENIEEGALKQALDLANHSITFKHIALMPDCHQGYGMPIGGVIACDHAIIPNAVGADIGCGMCVVKTSILGGELTKDNITEILALVKEKVPVGFNHHKTKQEWEGFNLQTVPDVFEVNSNLEDAKYQLGTMGSNNHFIEIQQGDDGHIWFMVHSGSRNFGYKIAREFNKIAIHLCNRWFSNIPNKDLAFFPIETKEAKEYLLAMQYALEFAAENRRRIMDELKFATGKFVRYDVLEEINIHHNYATWENHFGKNLLVHRKGAISARVGQKGIIPGSMGTPSYIVEGLGNPDSFNSCSHGAGRNMSKTKASSSLNEGDCTKDMDGIIFDGWPLDRKGNINLGEAPKAYKDIDEVIEAELDLIKPLVKLFPLGVIKG